MPAVTDGPYSWNQAAPCSAAAGLGASVCDLRTNIFTSTSSYQPRLLSLTAVDINPFRPHTFHRKCRSFRPGQAGDVYMSVGRWKVGLCDPPSILPWSSTNYYASYPDISFISESRSS